MTEVLLLKKTKSLSTAALSIEKKLNFYSLTGSFTAFVLYRALSLIYSANKPSPSCLPWILNPLSSAYLWVHCWAPLAGSQGLTRLTNFLNYAVRVCKTMVKSGVYPMRSCSFSYTHTVLKNFKNLFCHKRNCPSIRNVCDIQIKKITTVMTVFKKKIIKSQPASQQTVFVPGTRVLFIAKYSLAQN